MCMTFQFGNFGPFHCACSIQTRSFKIELGVARRRFAASSWTRVVGRDSST